MSGAAGLRRAGGRTALGDRTNTFWQKPASQSFGIKGAKKLDDDSCSALFDTRSRPLRPKGAGLKHDYHGLAMPADYLCDEVNIPVRRWPAQGGRAKDTKQQRCIVRTVEDETSELLEQEPVSLASPLLDEEADASPLADDTTYPEESSPARSPAKRIPASPSLLEQLQYEDRLKCRLEREIHIVVPPGVQSDRKVRVVMNNMTIELIVPEGAVEGEVVACDPPMREPMSRAAQRDLLLGSVQMRLRWQPSPEGSSAQFFDDGSDGRCRAKLERFRAMRGRLMGRVLPHLKEEDGDP